MRAAMQARAITFLAPSGVTPGKTARSRVRSSGGAPPDLGPEAVDLLHQGRRHLDPALAASAALGLGAADAEPAPGQVDISQRRADSSPTRMPVASNRRSGRRQRAGA
jgi:hypothetical protein